ncbi:hypothetical protein LEP1GSC071_3835 [Leptospira santarosai str. JET]|nr:hypothetical protein LEP1GSC071_3835 [Leptospira santarosai str. JET]
MLSGDFVFDISLLQTILFALFAIMTLFQGRLFKVFCLRGFLTLYTGTKNGASHSDFK